MYHMSLLFRSIGCYNRAMIDARMQQDEADRLRRMLVTQDAFLPFFKGLLAGVNAAAAWKTYADAEENSVHVNYRVRTIEFNKTKYTMYAFWTTDEPTIEELVFLRDKSLEVSPGLMRAESEEFKTIQEWTDISKDMSRIQLALGDKQKKRYVYVAANTDDEMPLVIFSRKGDMINLFPVRLDVAKELGLDHPQVGIQTKL